ncbi:hypothetical protein PIB30_004431 [Stylosanthes scabra]|uniref:Uncharacterized protein n=1 Tax=Stylosanthes scabra TaxID=79078 RepID=A0ABU6V4D7_9FABA|nr:hypothetical protein [Stylosanthes scabra]
MDSFTLSFSELAPQYASMWKASNALAPPSQQPQKISAVTVAKQGQLDAMNEDVSYGQRGPDDDPTIEFKFGQEFQNKEPILMAIKTYNINRPVDYKILESD